MRPVPERIAARAAGEIHYNTGKPCRNGHLAKRWTSNGICTECGAKNHRQYLATHPDLEAKWARERRAKNPTGHRVASRRWYSKNRARASATMRAWKRANPERARELLARWIAENLDHHRANGAKRMRKRRGFVAVNGGSYTPEDIRNLRISQDYHCAACGKEVAGLEVDHIVPVTKGGTNDPSNLQLLCRRCNASKCNRDFLEWATERGYL